MKRFYFLCIISFSILHQAFPQSTLYEAEDHYQVVTDADGDIRAASCSSGGVISGDKAVRLRDIGDRIKIPFSVAAAGNYQISVGVRSGGGGAPVKFFTLGYVYEIDGHPASFVGDASSNSVSNPCFGTSYWGLMEGPELWLSAGSHEISIESKRLWAFVDYVALTLLSDQTNLPRPVSLRAAGISDSRIDLSWLDNAGHEGNYVLESSAVSGSGFTPLATLPANTTSYSHTGLRPGQIVYYRVKATDATSESAYSEEAMGVTLVPGPLVLYDFTAGSGTTVSDRSGIIPALHLSIDNPGRTSWLPGGGLRIENSTFIGTAGPAEKLHTLLQSSGAMTIEAWVIPANLTQAGPARIVTLSSSSSLRNFTLGQSSSQYTVRLRTTVTGYNGLPQIDAGPNLSPSLQHVVFTHVHDQVKIYVDGVLVHSDSRSGDYSNWDDGFRFGLGNEISGGRSWLGTFHKVAVYNRALGEAEVLNNYHGGYAPINGNVPDSVEIQALRDLYESTNGASWTNNTGWPPSTTAWDAITSLDQVVGWHGVVIDSGDVIALALAGLEGTIPASLGDLSSLLSLTVSNSTIATLPESLGSLVNLINLNIEGTGITALPDISTLTQLKTLSVLNNALRKIPSSIQGLSELERIFMDRNNITDSIPDWLGGFAKLQVLLLQENPNLSGEIPASFAQLGSLQTLLMYQTSISGAVPEALLNLPDLRSISLFETNVDQLPDFKLHPNAVNLRMDYHNTLIDFGDIELNLSPDGSYIFNYFNFGILRNPTEVVKTTIQDHVQLLNDRSGGPNTTYQWQQWNGTTWLDIAGATQANLTLSGVDDTFIGKKYRCEMTNTRVSWLTLYSSAFALKGEIPPVTAFTHVPQYNGNISAIKWKTQGDSNEKLYAYHYDAMNRIEAAQYAEGITATNTWDKKRGGFQVHNISYDGNGNIQSLNRQAIEEDLKTIDALTYHYDGKGNQLMRVDDASVEQGFKDGNTSGNDYAYDANGNMTQDLNKEITKITYNYLNLPDTVFKADGQYIKYIYDAAGVKLAQEVYDAGNNLVKRTDYIGEFIYETEGVGATELSLIQHEEGRIIPPSGSTQGVYEYQYHLKDHLGNTRLTFTTQPETTSATATNETVNEDTERTEFLYYDDVTKINSLIFDHTNSGSTQYSVRLNGTTNERIGLAKSLQVMSGDVIRMEVYAKYLDPNSSNWTTALANLISSISSGTAAPGTVIDGASTGATAGFPFAGLFDNSGDNSLGPKAYLNWLVFDKNFVFVDGGYQPVTDLAIENGTDVPHEQLTAEITVAQQGYVYVYLSNDNATPIEVYFDDFTIEHVQTPVVQVDDYYPFGLVFNSWQRDNRIPNKFLFNGTERQTDLALGWDLAEFRSYDPAIARWHQIDPKSSERESPYVAMSNNPLFYSDPLGDTVIINVTGNMVGFTQIRLYSSSEIRDNPDLANEKAWVPVHEVNVTNESGDEATYYYTRFAVRRNESNDVTFDVQQDGDSFQGVVKSRWGGTNNVLELRDLNDGSEQTINGMKNIMWMDRTAIQFHAKGASDGCLMCARPSDIQNPYGTRPEATGTGSQTSFMNSVMNFRTNDVNNNNSGFIKVSFEKLRGTAEFNNQMRKMHSFRNFVNYQTPGNE